MYTEEENNFNLKQQAYLLNLIPEDCDDDIKQFEYEIITKNKINPDVMDLPEDKRNAVLAFYKRIIEYAKTI